MKQSDKVSLREAVRLHRRGLGDIRRSCPGLVSSSVLSNAVSALIPYVTIYLSARIINELAGLCRAETLWTLVLITIGAEAVLNLLSYTLKHWYEGKRSLFYRRILHIFADKMMDMDFADADRQETNDLLAQIKQNLQWNGRGYWAVLLQVLEPMTKACLGILGAVALTVSLFTLPVPESAGALTVLNHPAFLLGLLAVMALVTAVGPLCANKASAAEARLADEAQFGNRLFGFFCYLTDDAERAPDIRMYQQQDIAEYYMNLDNAFSPGGAFARLSASKNGVMVGLSQGIPSLFTGIVYVFVCLKALGGAFGVGSVTQYVSAVTALSRNIGLMMRALGYMKDNTLFMRYIYEFLDIPNHMYQGSLTTEKRSDRQYEVEFRDVSFQYPGSGNWALRHVNMKFKVGQRLAVVGENGSGKTTFIKLLCRLYDPREGQILLNGIDIRKYRYDDYMGVFSVVFQDFQLISQPLGANVAGSANYDRERVEQCLVNAGFGDRLAAMPKGLDTFLYKNLDKEGVEVSGGEAQKIAIARALYKDAPFIILDEPTAALDPMAEAEIYSKFNDIAGDKTAIYISHRLSSCKFCDEIAVFHEGVVIQQGTHEELLADESGKYHELWHAQAQYYTESSEEKT